MPTRVPFPEPTRDPAHTSGDDHTHRDDDDRPRGGVDPTPSSGDGSTATPTTPDTGGDASATTEGASGEAGIMLSVTKLLEAQRQMMAAQVQAMAAQSFPPLGKFSGEDCHTDEGSFDRWIERFEERAKIAGWASEQKLLQLKAHLVKTTEHSFRMMPVEEKVDYDLAVKSLRKRFHLLDIEELRGLEFHQLTQEKRSVEQLGMVLQKLARKAFPKMDVKEFDRLVKGRFYQALLPKWQRELGAPKAAESFDDLFTRARTVERHEQQFGATRSDPNQKGEKRRDRDESQGKQQPNAELTSEATANQSGSMLRKRRGECYICHEKGHIARYCPKSKESPGRSNSSSNVSMLMAEVLESLSIEQLEQILAKSRLQAEQDLMNKDSDVNTLLSTSGTSSAAIGPTFYLEIEIEGVPVRAVVDSAAQSTVIFRDLLHKVNRQRKANGHPCLTLGLPSATLHGKGGKDNSKLCITAQVELQLAVDGLVVTAPVFVQPSSSVPCLLGTNVLPQLGIRVVRANGQSLVESSVISGIPKSSRVHIIKSTYVPSRRATFVEAEMHSPLFGSDAVEFEPDEVELRAAGLNATNCLLTKMPNGHL